MRWSLPIGLSSLILLGTHPLLSHSQSDASWFQSNQGPSPKMYDVPAATKKAVEMTPKTFKQTEPLHVNNPLDMNFAEGDCPLELWYPEDESQSVTESTQNVLRQFQRTDGKLEVYFSTDPYADYALEQMNSFYSMINRNRTNIHGSLDNYPPLMLQEMCHRGVMALMRAWSDYTISQARSSPTGLVPYAAGGEMTSYTTHGRPFPMMQAHQVRMVMYVAQYLDWFPKNPILKQLAREYSQNFIRYHDYPDGPFASWVDVDTGGVLGNKALISDFGFLVEGMYKICKYTRDCNGLEWLDRELDEAWRRRGGHGTALFPQWYWPQWKGEDHRNIYANGKRVSVTYRDSDNIYLTLRFYEVFNKFGMDDFLSKWIQQVVVPMHHEFYQNAYFPEFGHFTRYLDLRGRAKREWAGIYGDGMWNTLRAMVMNYHITGNEDYWTRFKEAYQNLIEGPPATSDGFLAQRIFQGIPDGPFQWEEDDDPGDPRLNDFQTILLEVGVDAYAIRSDPDLRSIVTEYADRIFHDSNRDAKLIRTDQAGRTYLKLAQLLNPLKRVEIDFGGRNRTLTIEKWPDRGRSFRTEKVDERVVEADIGIIYMPSGYYRFTVNGKSKTISVNEGMRVELNPDLPWPVEMELAPPLP